MENKKIKVFVLVNTLTSVNSFVYANHIEFFVWHAKHHPEIEFAFFPPYRMSIDAARNTAAQYALNLQCDYLLFIDDDVMIPRDSLWQLIQNDKDICAGLVYVRGYPFNAMAFRFSARSKAHKNLGHLNEFPDKRGLVKVDAVGFSLALIKVGLLKKVSQPYFITGTGNTEDVYFCINVQDQIGKKHVSIYIDTAIECGHLLNPEPVCFSNRAALKRYYDTVLPKPKEEGRGREYFSKNLKLLK